MGMTRFGGYATHLVVNAAFLRPLPPKWSFEQVPPLREMRPFVVLPTSHHDNLLGHAHIRIATS
eukprot:414654-Rhodomonas_salina.1